MPKPERSAKRPARPDLAASPEPALVRVAPARALAVDGKGEPGGEAFHRALEALYGAAWTVKMKIRKPAGKAAAIGPLEGLWWGLEPGHPPAERRDWRWKLLLRVDPPVGARELAAARRALEARGRGAGEVRVEVLREGACVQAMHVGPYRDEPATIERMEAFARERNLAFAGAHHEIYLSDPRRTAPSRLRTILRHPVRPARARRAA
jgi:hypothetical protein